MKRAGRFGAATLSVMLMLAPVANEEPDGHVLIHVKTALTVDDALICAVPNVVWATVSHGKQVTLLLVSGPGRSCWREEGFLGDFVRIEVLYIRGCGSHRSVVEMAQEVVEELELDADIEEVPVRSASVAERLRFLGSPSMRVDGVDVEPSARLRTKFGLG